MALGTARLLLHWCGPQKRSQLQFFRAVSCQTLGLKPSRAVTTSSFKPEAVPGCACRPFLPSHTIAMSSSSLLPELNTQHEQQPWASNLVALHGFVWDELVKGLQDRHSVNRFPTLVTLSQDGRPQARTVVLRGASRDEWQLDIYTESDSAKAAELKVSPRTAIHIWNTATRLQVRMEAHAMLIQGDEARQVWESLPLASQLTCGKTPPTGSVIKDSLAYQIDADPDKFLIARLVIDRMDVLHLGEMHRRALFQRNTREFGQWCVP